MVDYIPPETALVLAIILWGTWFWQIHKENRSSKKEKLDD